jgi:hypothetical protein
MEIKWVEVVFTPAWKILAELPNEEVGERETDARNICTS